MRSASSVGNCMREVLLSTACLEAVWVALSLFLRFLPTLPLACSVAVAVAPAVPVDKDPVEFRLGFAIVAFKTSRDCSECC